MKFEWDTNKSINNKEKHGIDFESARSLWNDPDRIEILAPYPLENRYILIGKIGVKIWSAIYTLRGKTIRIISVRGSRKQEKRLYEQKENGKK